MLTKGMDKKTPKYWVIAPGRNAYLWDECLVAGVIRIGWGKLKGNLSALTDSELEKKCKLFYPSKLDFTQVRYFVKDMKIGDWLFVKKGRERLVGYGKVISTIMHDNHDNDFSILRQVHWERNGEVKLPKGMKLLAQNTLTPIRANAQEKLQKLLKLVDRLPKTGTVSPKDEPDSFEDEDECAFPEGVELYKKHRYYERNPEVVKEAKRRASAKGNLQCCICEFDFHQTYGELGKGFIECHHILPISESKKRRKTKPEDLALVCSNCHRMLHRKRPWLGMAELSKLIERKIKKNNPQ